MEIGKEKLGGGADAVFVSVGAVSVYDTAPISRKAVRLLCWE